MSIEKKLDGKVAIVTGAASGIGLATAQLFLEHGAKVVVVDLPDKKVAEKFGPVVAIDVDVTDPTAAEKIVEATTAAHGRLDILVNNAGICEAGQFEDITDEMWDRVMGVNVTAMFKLSRAAVPIMRERDRGRIINVGSIMSDMGGPSLSIYGASKHAVAGLTKGMAVDLGKYQITVNYLQPGAIITGLSEPFMADPEFRAYWENKAPIGRLGNPEDVAVAALFLASDEAQFVTGVGLNVDGGAIVNF